MEQIAYRGKEWLFNALWAACMDSKNPRCAVDLPPTVIFRSGMPHKLLAINHVSKSMNATLVEVLNEGNSTVYDSQLGALKNCRQLFVEYQEDRGYGDTQDREEPYLCTVTYCDGDREHITVRKFDTLIRSDTWRVQVLLLQGYVPTKKTVNGNYTHDPKKLERLEDLSELEIQARSLAKCAERAYAVSPGALQEGKLSTVTAAAINNNSKSEAADLFDGSESGSIGSAARRLRKRVGGIGRGKEEKDIVLHVRNVNAVFGLDPQDRSVLLYCDYILVEMESGRKAVEDFLKRERGGREGIAADAVSQDLLQLMLHAQRRGLTATHSFSHFDLNNTGVVDVNTFVEGLARLGIGVTYPIAELVMQNIGGMGVTFLTSQDFAAFLDREKDSVSAAGAGGGGGRGGGGSSVTIASSMTASGETKEGAGGEGEAVGAEGSLGTRRAAWAADPRGAGGMKKKSKPGDMLAQSELLDISFEDSQEKVRSSLGTGDLATKSAVALDFDPDAYEPPKRRQRLLRSRGGGGGGNRQERSTRDTAAAAGFDSEQGSRRSVDSSHQPGSSRPASQSISEQQQQRQQGTPGSPSAYSEPVTYGTASNSSIVVGADEGTEAITGWNSSSPSSPERSSLVGGILNYNRSISISGAASGSSPSRATAASAAAGRRVAWGDGGDRTSATPAASSSSSASALSDIAAGSLRGIRSESLLQSAAASQSAAPGGALTGADELLHLSDGVVMTYRVVYFEDTPYALEPRRPITGAVASSSNRPSSAPDLTDPATSRSGPSSAPNNDPVDDKDSLLRSSRKKKNPAKYKALALADDRDGSLGDNFTLVVIPDIFQTLDSLQQQLQQLLLKYPLARLLLVGLPGLPNTLWPADWILNSDLHARAIAKLLQHLDVDTPPGTMTQNQSQHHLRLSSTASDPVFFMGVGSGANSMLRFAVQLLPKMPKLQGRVRALCVVNGVLKFNGAYRQVCKDLRKGLLRATSPEEVQQLVNSLHFCTGYLDQNGSSEDCFRQFWVARRGLASDAAAAGGGSGDDDRAGIGYVGVLEQLKGLLITPDDFDGASILTSSNVPVIVAQSTEDVFVNPRNASVFQASQLPPERTLVKSLEQSLSPGAVHVSWLKAGHEVLQERKPFIIGLLANLAQIAGVRPADSSALMLPQEITDEGDAPFVDPDSQLQNTSASAQQEGSVVIPPITGDDEKSDSRNRTIAPDGTTTSEGAESGPVKRPSFFLKLSASTRIPIPELSSSPVRSTVTPSAINLAGILSRQLAAVSEVRSESPLGLSLSLNRAAATATTASTAAEDKEQRKRELKEKTTLAIEKRRIAAERAREQAESEHMEEEEIYTRYIDEVNRRIEEELERQRVRRQLFDDRQRAEKERVLKEIERKIRRQLIQRAADRRRKTAELMRRLQENEVALLPTVSAANSLAGGAGGVGVGGRLSTTGSNAIAAAGGGGGRGPGGWGGTAEESRTTAGSDAVSTVSSMTESMATGGLKLRDKRTKGKKSKRNLLSNVVSSTLFGDAGKNGGGGKGGGTEDAEEDEMETDSISTFTARHDRRLIQIEEMIGDAFNSFKEYLLHRSRAIEARKRVYLLSQKLDEQVSQREKADGDSKRIERVIKLLTENPWMVGPGFNPTQEIDTLKRSLFKKDDIFAHFADLATLRDQQMNAALNSARPLEHEFESAETEVNSQIISLQLTEHELSGEIDDLRRMQEKFTVEKDMCHLRDETMSKRVRQISDELEKILKHEHELIDTDVWIEGYMQRYPTAKLVEFITAERNRLGEELRVVKNEHAEKAALLADLRNRLRRSERSHELISAALREFMASFETIRSKHIDDIVKDLSLQEKDAEEIEAKRTREQGFSRVVASLGADNPVDRIRMKDVELRTKDEKAFVAVDLVMFPEVYVHLTPEEAEKMKFDQDYNTELTKSDLDRIYMLPEQINLALPFLHTQQEVEAHRLLNTYWRSQDESFYIERDYNSFRRDEVGTATGGESGSAAALAGNERGKMSKTLARRLRAQEARHDIQLREARRDRIRSLGVGEEMSAEERVWLRIDHTLAPHIFSSETVLFYADEKHLPRPFTRSDARTKEEEEVEKKKKKAALSQKNKSQHGDDDNDDDIASITQPKYDFENWVCPFSGDQLVAIYHHFQKQQEIEFDDLDPVEGVDDVDNDEEAKETDFKDPANFYDGNSAHDGVVSEARDDATLSSVNSQHTDDDIDVAAVAVAVVATDNDDDDAGERSDFISMADPQDLAKTRYLMRKYFVDEDESVLGHQRLKSLLQLSHSIVAFMRKRDIARKPFHKEDALSVGSQGSSSIDLAASVATSISHDPINDEESLDTLGSLPNLQMKDRSWGSWEHVHPASAGANSQTSLFMKASYSASRDHPASYALRAHHSEEQGDEEEEDSDDEDDKCPFDLSMVTVDEVQQLGIRRLLALPAAKSWLKRQDRESRWVVAGSITELSKMTNTMVKGRIVLLEREEAHVLYHSKENTLMARQSRSHHFEVPEKDDINVLDITVSIVFQGQFNRFGYRPGRIAASLFRLPEDEGKLPMPVGFAPYALQSPNLPETIGRIVIVHRPRAKPLKPGIYRIVIGAAAFSKYTVQVSCKYAQAALPIVDEEITGARQMQNKFSNCLADISCIEETIRLSERKLLVCRKMIMEAESESQRCQNEVRVTAGKLECDDEDMMLSEAERLVLENTLKRFETDYVKWASAFISRTSEHEDITHGIEQLYEQKQKQLAEKATMKEDLERMRRELPACIAVLRSNFEAANVAAGLNATFEVKANSDGTATEAQSQTSGDVGTVLNIVTPAEEVRKRTKREGFGCLSIEEQKWSLLDQALYPSKYEWMREHEEEEEAKRRAMGKTKKKAKKLSPAVESYRMTKVEIEHVQKAPFSTLSRRDVLVRKLLAKYHDNPTLMRRGVLTGTPYGFDPHLAEHTRCKHPNSYSLEDTEWASMDQILHPDIWNYYVNKDPEEAFKDKIAAGRDRAVSRGTDGGKPQANTSASAKENYTNVLGRLLGIDQAIMSEIKDELGASATANVKNFASIAHRKSLETKKKVWKCKWPKEDILRVWRSPKHDLQTEEERHAFDLLMKYSGTYKAYLDANDNWRYRQKEQYVKELGKAVNHQIAGKIASYDLDFRARSVLRELDRAEGTNSLYMDTDAIHANDHRYATELLKSQLGDELDRLLMEQIRDAETGHRKNVDSSDDGDDSSEGGLSDEVIEEDADPDEVFNLMKTQQERAAKRARKQRKALKEEDMQRLRSRKMVVTKNKSGQALIEAMLQNKLGHGGCIACRSNPCRWSPSIDEDICLSRRRELEDELERVKHDKETKQFESFVALSAQLGGNTVFRRLDLIDELSYELRELKFHIELNNVDKDLHDAYASRKEYIEVTHLHGFSAMLWTNNARVALAQRQHRLVATTVAKEVIDDILDWMLEGWFFGERESSFSALGYVPTLKPGGAGERVCAGQDQIRTVSAVVQKMQRRADAKKQGVLLDEFRRGKVSEKAAGIEESSQFNLIAKQIIKEGEDQKHLLNETETTLRFGLFMMTLMYFRAMALLEREKKSWSGEDDHVNVDAKGKKAAPKMNIERMRMVSEDRNAAARMKRFTRAMELAKVGEMRKKERYDRERREEVQRRQAIVLRKKLEDKSARVIQRIARGYWGRKAAKRWALKRAEWEAMKAVMIAAAIKLQRRWRGVLGRRVYAAIRIEMTQFIAIVRLQEANADEEDFWETHPWRRFKKNAKQWVERKAYELGASRNIVYGGPKMEDMEINPVTMREMAVEAAKKAVVMVKNLAPGVEERARLKAEQEEGDDHLTDDGLESEGGDFEPRRPPPQDILAIGSGDAAAAGGGGGDDNAMSVMSISGTDAADLSSKSQGQGDSEKSRSRRRGGGAGGGGRRSRVRGEQSSPDVRTNDQASAVATATTTSPESAMRKKNKKKGGRKSVRIMEEGGEVVTPNSPPPRGASR